MRNSGYSNRDSYFGQTSYSSRDTYPGTGRNSTRSQNNRPQYSQRDNFGFGNLRSTHANQSFGNQSFRSLDEAINNNEIHDVITQRIGNDLNIFGEHMTFTDSTQITECKNYANIQLSAPIALGD